MLIKNLNDEISNIEDTANFIADLHPKKSYLSITIRPPAKTKVKPISETNLNIAYQVFKKSDIDTEYLVEYEGNNFGFTGGIK